MDRRKVGRALVLLGAALLLAGDMLLLAERTSAHGEILGDVWLWGLGEALSEEGGHIGAYKLLANTFDHVYLLCAAALAPLLLRGSDARSLGLLAAHVLGFAFYFIREFSLVTAWGLLVALGVAALIAGAALLARRRPRSGRASGRYGRAAGDVTSLALAFLSGNYLFSACCVVANEFYASGMARMAGQVGHPVDRAWVVRFLAYFVVTSTVLLLAAVERRGGHGEVRHGRVPLLAAACAALIALSCLGIVGRYPYYTIPRTAQMLVCLCALCLVGEALERVGSRLDGEASRAAPEGEAG